MVRRLISILVKDIIKNTKLNIKKYNIQSDKCVRAHPKQPFVLVVKLYVMYR